MVKKNYFTYTKPEMEFNNVLFPAPDGPKIADKLPASNLPLTDFKIHLSASETSLKKESVKSN